MYQDMVPKGEEDPDTGALLADRSHQTLAKGSGLR